MTEVACVVLPTYNEASNVSKLIPRIFAQADHIPTHELHVLIVDDESPDGTSDVVRKLQQQWPHLHLLSGEKKGLGVAYTRGFDYATNELNAALVFQMDADFQHDPTLLPLFASLSQFGFSLVIGSRFGPGGSTPDFDFRRRLMSRVATWLVCRFGGVAGLRDCTSGYRCISTAILRNCDLSKLSTRGYSFQSSLLCELIWRGAKVIEIPIVFGKREAGESKLTFRDQLEFLVSLPRLFMTGRKRRRAG
ncbi:MAG: polyprenol monophosphomannose synthase [Acidobacteriia bacterium]|nr:polyprenol monophosphomannose synthase [Terriglobia bacterium]